MSIMVLVSVVHQRRDVMLISYRTEIGVEFRVVLLLHILFQVLPKLCFPSSSQPFSVVAFVVVLGTSVFKVVWWWCRLQHPPFTVIGWRSCLRHPVFTVIGWCSPLGHPLFKGYNDNSGK
ncbi:hypothetical protein VNO80_06464 [Phaseolus coccineus]|uniref:Uncharacterized protein n=1 Tax=Phaseolus coccineus TaxID=3886 RepID=A0AAN9RNW2_PHACN